MMKSTVFNANSTVASAFALMTVLLIFVTVFHISCGATGTTDENGNIQDGDAPSGPDLPSPGDDGSGVEAPTPSSTNFPSLRSIEEADLVVAIPFESVSDREAVNVPSLGIIGGADQSDGCLASGFGRGSCDASRAVFLGSHDGVLASDTHRIMMPSYKPGVSASRDCVADSTGRVVARAPGGGGLIGTLAGRGGREIRL